MDGCLPSAASAAASRAEYEARTGSRESPWSDDARAVPDESVAVPALAVAARAAGQGMDELREACLDTAVPMRQVDRDRRRHATVAARAQPASSSKHARRGWPRCGRYGCCQRGSGRRFDRRRPRSQRRIQRYRHRGFTAHELAHFILTGLRQRLRGLPSRPRSGTASQHRLSDFEGNCRGLQLRSRCQEITGEEVIDDHIEPTRRVGGFGGLGQAACHVDLDAFVNN